MMSKTSSAKYYGEKKVKSLWEQICDGEFLTQIVHLGPFSGEKKLNYSMHDIIDLVP